MSDEHGHEPRGHEHRDEHRGHDDHGHDHDQDHDHDHASMLDRMPEGVWNIDLRGSELLFKARAFGILPVTGVFENFEGALTADGAGAVSGRLVVQMNSINTGWVRRDSTLRSASYFDIDRHPEMIFALDAIVPSGSEHMELSGSLQIQEKSVPLSFPVYLIAHRDHLHIEGEVTVDHDVASLGWSKPFFVGNHLLLEAALTLMRG